MAKSRACKATVVYHPAKIHPYKNQMIVKYDKNGVMIENKTAADKSQQLQGYCSDYEQSVRALLYQDGHKIFLLVIWSLLRNQMR